MHDEISEKVHRVLADRKLTLISSFPRIVFNLTNMSKSNVVVRNENLEEDIATIVLYSDGTLAVFLSEEMDKVIPFTKV